MSSSSPRSLLREGAIWLSICVVLMACGGTPPPQDFVQEPALFHRILDEVEARRGAYQGELKSTVWREGERLRGRQLFLFAAPERMRLTLLSPFEQPLSDLVYEGGQLKLWLMQENRFFAGPATPAALARLLRVELPPSLFLGALRGYPARITAEGGRVEWDRERGEYLFSLEEGAKRQEFFFSADRSQLSCFRAKEEGRLLYEVKLSAYREGIARSISLEHPAADLRLELRIKELSPLETVDESLFELAPPEGITAEAL